MLASTRRNEEANPSQREIRTQQAAATRRVRHWLRIQPRRSNSGGRAVENVHLASPVTAIRSSGKSVGALFTLPLA